jgi:hypothetical protein
MQKPVGRGWAIGSDTGARDRDMTKGDYLERRLERSGSEALVNAQVAVNHVQSEAAKMGALGGSRVYLLYDEAVGNVLAEALQHMAVIAFRVSSGTSAATSQLLEKVGYKFVDDITDWLHTRYKSEIALGYHRPAGRYSEGYTQ